MKNALLLVMLASSTWCAVTTSNLFYTGGVNPGFTNFTIDGITGRQLLCDQFFPNITTSPYNSQVYGLSDITLTSDVALIRAGNSVTEALQKYILVALLDRMAYANSSFAADVVLANRRVVDGSGPTTAQSDILLALAQAQSVSTTIAQLSDFRIYSSPLNLANLGGTPLTQEMTGIIAGNVPEPATGLLIGAGLASAALVKRRKITD